MFKYNGILLHTVDFSKSELYEVMWRPGRYETIPLLIFKKGKYEDRSASPGADKEIQDNKVDDKPKRLFQPNRSGIKHSINILIFEILGAFAAMLKAVKVTSGCRNLDSNERFDNEPESPIEEKKEEPKKKKRIRKKKDKTGEEDNEVGEVN